MGKLKRKIIRKAAKYAFNSLKDSAVKSVTETATEKKQPEQAAEKPASKSAGSIVLRQMRRSDRAEVMEMMREHCSSKAALNDDSDAVFSRVISECLSGSKFLDGYVFAYKDADDSLWGYALVAHGFSSELGKPCMWTEEIYIREEARNLGLTSEFLSYIGDVYPNEAFRFKEEGAE